MTHEPECTSNEARLTAGATTGQQGTGYPNDFGNAVYGIGYGPCICDRLRAAYRRGFNDHARTVQHWQDTHGAYRQHGNGENP